MKRPEKLKLDSLTFGHNLSGDVRQGNGKIWGANEMWEDWKKYHNWYIKENCVRKKDLPSEEKIEEVCKWGFERHPGVSPKEIAQAISKLIKGKK